ncbi:hypothetical protein Ddye_001212 [Dipteronia dyeriana]|uniref:(+)-lariciresinol reductase n=1 Tax=Dipteronia dyeriana TaxID=168575 RepID=A0AAE0CTS9_9ROSI|nr:hypothetical protein Ddye_001212 [Dipteronia dyeriana]
MAVEKSKVLIVGGTGYLGKRTHQILLQLKLVHAIQEAGNVKRFLPSEFGTDPAKMDKAMEPGRITFDDKMKVRKAIEEAGIPYTYVSANCFAGYFLGGLCQPGQILPSKDHVVLLGDGNPPAIYVDEDDIAMYTIKAIDDPRTLNKTVYISPPKNILSQRQVAEIWEKLIGKELHKSSISKEEFLAAMKEQDYAGHITTMCVTRDVLQILKSEMKVWKPLKFIRKSTIPPLNNTCAAIYNDH